MALAGLTAALVTVLPLAMPTAEAQTGYPPPPCTATFSASAFGSATVGSTVTLTLQPTCAWTANASVEVLVNGQSVGTKTANANGFVTVAITVVSASTLSVDDPVLVSAVCGTNTVVGRGPSTVASGQVVTHQATFTVTCGQAGGGGVDVRPGRRVALTGADVATWLAVALAAMVAGTLFVVAGRRRKRARVSA